MHHIPSRLLSLALLAVLGCCLAPVPGVQAAPGDRISVAGKDWLDGKGVDAIYPPSGSPVPYPYKSELQEKFGGRYQCLEFVVRLYDQLGYGRWPGQVNIPADLITVVQRAKDGVRGYENFRDLVYTPNGGSTPPRPGDILINAGGGHVGIVNRVAGTKIELVQQNRGDGKNNPAPIETIALTFAQDGFSVAGAVGWIHSPRMDSRLNQTNIVPVPQTNNQLSWNRDADTVYVYLSEERTKQLASQGAPAAETVANLLSQGGQLRLTNVDYARCLMRRAAALTQQDDRFRPDRGVRSIDVTLKYAGTRIWVRPWGGSANSTWIEIPGVQCTWEGKTF